MKTSSLLLLFTIATSLSAFAAYPPAAIVQNEVHIVNDTNEPLTCIIGPGSATLLPTVQSQAATLRFPRPHAQVESRLEPGQTLTITNVQVGELILVGGQLLQLNYGQMRNTRCTFTASRPFWKFRSLSISEPTCHPFSPSAVNMKEFEEVGATGFDIGSFENFLQLPDSDPARILGVAPGASIGQIKAAYETMMQKLQPHLVTDPHEKSLLFQADAKVKRAYQSLVGSL
jgi:hypothetical protein